MTAAIALLAEATGGALLASATLDGLAAVSRRRQPARAARSGPAVRARRLGRRLAARCDATASGRRLSERLDAASVAVTPARWRAAQIVAVVPATLLVAVAGVPLLWAFGVASSGVRLGAWGYLRGRRDRRDDELVEAAATLARHLATELASGSAAVEALGSLASARDARAAHRLDAIVTAASARAALGEPIASALGAAVSELPAGRGRDALALLATELALVVDRGCGTAVLTRFASGIEEQRQTVAEVRANTAEIRMATVAIPAMALAVASLLVLTDRAVAAAALSPIGAAVGLALGGVAACAVIVARRVTSPFEPR